MCSLSVCLRNRASTWGTAGLDLLPLTCFLSGCLRHRASTWGMAGFAMLVVRNSRRRICWFHEKLFLYQLLLSNRSLGHIVWSGINNSPLGAPTQCLYRETPRHLLTSELMRLGDCKQRPRRGLKTASTWQLLFVTAVPGSAYTRKRVIIALKTWRRPHMRGFCTFFTAAANTASTSGFVFPDA